MYANSPNDFVHANREQETGNIYLCTTMPQDKARIPQAGETVYLKDDSRCIAMYLERVYTKNKVQFAQCTWTEYEMFNDELLSHPREKEFLLSELTVYPPVKS